MSVEDQTNEVLPQENNEPQPINAPIREPEPPVPDNTPNETSKQTRGMSKSAKIFGVVSGLTLFTFILLLSRGVSFFNFGRTPAVSLAETSTTDVALTAGSVEKFDYLSQQRSSSCSLQPETVLTYADEMRLQGSCCSPMDLGSYQAQVAGLEAYSDIAQIPNDPYDVPASLAKELLEYQRDIQLTAPQQAVYDQAMSLSDEGGPCCCRCWRWYAFEGLAKYLITQRSWNAQQIADLWGLVDGCGGPGEQHG